MKPRAPSESSRFRAELTDLESAGQLRDLEILRGVDLNSNDYLGLSSDPRLKQAILEAVNSARRISSTGSRLLSGHDDAWTALEQDFARWVGTESALYFTSGYAANVGLLGAILRPKDIVFSDEANHASLIDGMRLANCRREIFPHLDLTALENLLRRHDSPGGMRVIVVESIFSMEGDRAPLADLQGLAERYGAELIVDEAHATGVCGEGGRGCVAEAGISGRILATVHTCGKALASAGAFVCGSEQLRRILINRARTFIFSTALPPYFAAHVAAGMRLAMAADRERSEIETISARWREKLRQNSYEIGRGSSHIVPVILGSNEIASNFAARLRDRGFAVRPIRPPTVPVGTSRLRLSLTAKLTEENLAGFIAALDEAREHQPAGRSTSALS